MKYRKLGSTDIDVSVICLGTMTFGEQNSQIDSFRQMDYALDRGVNFIDTADVYSDGESERIIGKAVLGERDKWIIASKVGLSAFSSKHPTISIIKSPPIEFIRKS